MNTGKTIRRAILIALGAIAILIAAAYVLIHTTLFTNYARGKAVQAAEAKLGARVRIQSLSIPWGQLAVNVRGLTIAGRGGPTQAPLVQIPRLKVAIAAAPLLSGHLQLSQVILERAAVHIAVNSQGESNLPTPVAAKRQASARSPSPVSSIFNLGIRHLQIDDATIFYENGKIPLSADLADFNAEVYFNTRSAEYYGALGYGSGTITARNFEPVAHRANLQFTASPSQITCNPLTITLPHSQLALYATIQNYSHPHVNGRYEAQISTSEVAQVLRQSSIPEGSIVTSGMLQYRNRPENSFWNALQIQGTLRSPQLTVHLRQLKTPMTALRASYSLENGRLRIANANGQLLGGQLTVNSGELSLTGESRSALSAVLTNVSIHEVSQALPSGAYDRLDLVGRADLIAQLSWDANFSSLVINTRANIDSPPDRELSRTEVPLNGAIQLVYDRARARAELGNSQLRVGNTMIAAAGVLSRNSSLKLTFTAANLHQTAALTAEIARAAKSKTSASLEIPSIQGSAQFEGRAYGSLRNPHLTGHLTGRDVQIDSTRWKTIQSDIALSPSQAALTNALLISAANGQIHADASVALRRWALAPSSQVSMHATIAHVSISNAQSLARMYYPIGGTLSAGLTIRGTRRNPAGNGWIRVVNATAWDQPLKSVSANFQGDTDSVHADLRVDSPAGPIVANAVYHPVPKAYQLDLHTPGLKLAELELVQARHLPLRGILVANGSGSGTIANPVFSMAIASSQLSFHGETVTDFRSNMNLANRELNWTADAALYNGTFQARGSVALTGAYQTTATLDVRSVSVGMIAARYLGHGQSGPKGQADLHAEIQGPLRNPAQLKIRAEVPAMTLEYQPVRVSLAEPMILEYQNGVAVIEKSRITGNGVALTFAGQIPIKRSAPFAISANGAVNLNAFQAITPELQTAGQVSLNLSAHGTLAEPNLQGNLQLRNVAIASVSMPVDLSGFNGNIRVSGRRMELMNLAGHVNGGSLAAQGTVDLGKAPAFDLVARAKSVDVSYPAGVRTRLDGDLQFSGTSAASMLTGRVVIDYLGLAQQVDIASLASQFSSGGGVSAPSSFEKHVKLNVALQSSSTVSLASSQLSIQGAANLDIVGTLADPVVLGRATLTRGEIFFMGKRYEIKSGTIEFANPTRTNPTVDLYATTTVNQYDISIHFLGPVSQMKTSFTSTPPLPQADVINLLAFGRTTEAAATGNPTPGAIGAESVIAQGVASQVSGKIQRLAGISQLAITPILASAQQNPGAQIAIQQRVSGRLLVTFTTNTAETQSTAVQVQYQLGGGLSVSVLRDQNGGYGVDMHLHKSF